MQGRLGRSTLLVWDIGPRPALAGKLGAKGLMKAWARLAGADAAQALQARWQLAASSKETILLLKERLRPARSPDGERLRRLLADLGSEQFRVRQKAQAELEALGSLVEPALRQVLKDKITLEVRRRVQQLLDRLRGPVTRPEELRAIRAVAVLEDIATPETRHFLETLATGAPGARLSREARAALERLSQRTSRQR